MGELQRDPPKDAARPGQAPAPSPTGTPVLVGDEASAQTDKASPAEHLRAFRFQKGVSGNPGGRPKGRSVSAILREILEQDHNGKALGQILAERLVKEALSGKLGHAKEVLDRTEGAAMQKIEVSQRPITVVLVPPEHASRAEIDALREEAQARLPATCKLLVGRCWVEELWESDGGEA